MLELLTHTTNAEAVIAAVQNGADGIYFTTEDYRPRRGMPAFAEDELPPALRYCRIRGCRVCVALELAPSDRELAGVVAQAARICQQGAQALIVHDLGLAAALRQALPDIALYCGARMDIHSIAGAMAAAEMGFSQILLSPELSLDEIARIAARVPAKILVLAHGSLCFSHRGQCYMSALAGTGRDSCGNCAAPCRGRFSMGSSSPEYPLSQKDLCLADRLADLEAAGVSGVLLDGFAGRPELAGYVTGLYCLAAHQRRAPLPDELRQLQERMYPGGLTRGWIDGAAGQEMFGLPCGPDREAESILTRARRNYDSSEQRRVPVEFFALGRGDQLHLAVQDADGHKVVLRTSGAIDPIGSGMTQESLSEHFHKTAGTPYSCEAVHTAHLEHMIVSGEQMDELRRSLLAELTEQRGAMPQLRQRALPDELPAFVRGEPPVINFQVLTAEQLTPELAELEPELLYVPLEVLSESFGAVLPFMDRGTRPVAVLPRVITDGELGEVARMLYKLRSLGVNEVLVGNLGHIAPARMAQCRIRGDFGLNLMNARGMRLMKAAQLVSVTASFELSLTQLQQMNKPLDTELIVYGRVPVMVSDHCIIKQSSGGKCVCQKPNALNDHKGGVYPVVREFGCRNVVCSSRKLFLGDERAAWQDIGLWAVRLYFTTESPRECVEVARSFAGQSDYVPNNITRGLYHKGAG